MWIITIVIENEVPEKCSSQVEGSFGKAANILVILAYILLFFSFSL